MDVADGKLAPPADGADTGPISAPPPLNKE
jgi:hypothetical protein